MPLAGNLGQLPRLLDDKQRHLLILLYGAIEVSILKSDCPVEAVIHCEIIRNHSLNTTFSPCPEMGRSWHLNVKYMSSSRLLCLVTSSLVVAGEAITCGSHGCRLSRSRKR